MKLRLQTKTGIWIEFDANDSKEAVERLSDIQNVFNECECGVCGGKDLRYMHAENGGFNFYELHCLNPDCRARLNFGQRREDGGLFPRRKHTETGEYLPNNGWSVYRRESESDQYYTDAAF